MNRQNKLTKGLKRKLKKEPPIEDNLLRKLEKMLILLENEETRNDDLLKQLKKEKKNKTKLKKINDENKILKNEIQSLNKKLTKNKKIKNDFEEHSDDPKDLINNFKTNLIDIEIKNHAGKKKLRECGKYFKNFFQNELNCDYIYIHCNALSTEKSDLLKIKQKKKPKKNNEVLSDRINIYTHLLKDIEFNERIVGKFIIGRYPLNKKEDEKILHEEMIKIISIVKKILEDEIFEIQNKEMATRDPLTGLYNRNFMMELLEEEFNNLNLLNHLNPQQLLVLNTIIKANGKSNNIIKNQYFHDYNTKDDTFFFKTISKLLKLNIISITQEKYLGKIEDHYHFINSKKNYTLHLATLDLDNFKSVNDEWGGHSAGDKILKQFSDIIKNNIRSTDIPIRYGGEEFVIIFRRSHDYYKILVLLEKIRCECEESLIVSYNNKIRKVTVSVGVTTINKYDKNPNHIIKRSDEALYWAKKKKNRIIRCDIDNEGSLNYY